MIEKRIDGDRRQGSGRRVLADRRMSFIYYEGHDRRQRSGTGRRSGDRRQMQDRRGGSAQFNGLD